jgi:hypothetical protein
MRDCPRCNAPVDGDNCTLCGWHEPGVETKADLERHLCHSTDGQGNRCRAPGALADSTLGSDQWWCHRHFPPFRARNFNRTAPPTGWRKPLHARRAADLLEDAAERLAIQQEGSASA